MTEKVTPTPGPDEVAAIAYAECTNISPDNPLAVAEAIGEMVRMLGEVHDQGIVSSPDDLRALLTRIGRKP